MDGSAFNRLGRDLAIIVAFGFVAGVLVGIAGYQGGKAIWRHYHPPVETTDGR